LNQTDATLSVSLPLLSVPNWAAEFRPGYNFCHVDGNAQTAIA
jgi:hypothetical protein